MNGYDVGNITNITNSADANPNWSYAYDERYRLTQYAEHQSGLGTVWTRNYTYDPGDNLVTKTISDTSTQIVFQYNAANELTRRTENVAKEHA